jgi:hypothetical protein
MLSHVPSNEPWMVEVMLDLPDRGTPFNTTMRPSSVTPTSQRKSIVNTTVASGVGRWLR